MDRSDEKGLGVGMDAGPALVSIMRQGPNLIASIHTALDDTEMTRFQRDLIDQVGQHRSRGIIIDVAALDVLDSFGSHTLRKIAEMARLRGALTVIVGIQPDVAFAMVELGMDTGNVHTALDLEEGLAYLGHGAATRRLAAEGSSTSRDDSCPRPRTQLSGCLPALSAKPGRGCTARRLPDRSSSRRRRPEHPRAGAGASPESSWRC